MCSDIFKSNTTVSSTTSVCLFCALIMACKKWLNSVFSDSWQCSQNGQKSFFYKWIWQNDICIIKALKPCIFHNNNTFTRVQDFEQMWIAIDPHFSTTLITTKLMILYFKRILLWNKENLNWLLFSCQRQRYSLLVLKVFSSRLLPNLAHVIHLDKTREICMLFCCVSLDGYTTYWSRIDRTYVQKNV